jgi:hypothetical protein
MMNTILARVFFWLNVQRRSDLREAMHSPKERERIERARPLGAAAYRCRCHPIAAHSSRVLVFATPCCGEGFGVEPGSCRRKRPPRFCRSDSGGMSRKDVHHRGRASGGTLPTISSFDTNPGCASVGRRRPTFRRGPSPTTGRGVFPTTSARWPSGSRSRTGGPHHGIEG